ncbi:MAG TPA: hypothetical protein VGT98_04260, partial [Candidatus Elarobacter sp.]|nr:hypothetical protein [Candidatus Elarobacter sp.]
MALVGSTTPNRDHPMRVSNSMLRRRSLITRAFGSIAAANAVALLSACMLFARPPQNLDYSRTRSSEGGHYVATI